MKLIIAGSRNFTSYDVMVAKLAKFEGKVAEVVSGTARGADTLGERWAAERGIPVKRFPADWNRYGNRAGFLRNEEMAKYGDELAAFWDGVSRGTKSMIRVMKAQKKPVHIFPV